MAKLLLFKELRDEGVFYTRRYLDRLEREGKFPRRVPIGTYRVGWVADEIKAHVKKAIDSRSTEIGVLGSGRK
jgi:hypothetical protein